MHRVWVCSVANVCCCRYLKLRAHHESLGLHVDALLNALKLRQAFHTTDKPAATVCASAATCTLPENDSVWAGAAGREATPLHIAL